MGCSGQAAEGLSYFQRPPTHKKMASMPQRDISDIFEYFPKFFDEKTCSELKAELEPHFPQERCKTKIYGKECNIPRDQMVAFFGGDGRQEYVYSKHKVPKMERPTPTLMRIKSQMDEKFGCEFNFVLVNRYKDGKDAVGWHADDEKEIDQRFPIVSISIGGERDFDLKLKADPSKKARKTLRNGDLISMKGRSGEGRVDGCQDLAQHTVPKRANAKSRINLTFRCLKVKEEAASDLNLAKKRRTQ